jgi:hypothetical protein
LSRSASSARVTPSAALPLARGAQGQRLPSALMITSSGATGGWLLLPTLGRSTLPVWIMRRGDHEDHQQHQHHVDVGHDVDFVE